MTPAGYLARLGGARAVYRALVREAVDLLAPARVGAQESDRLVAFQPAGALARTCGISRATVLAELERLRNHGWFVPLDGGRLLGHRHGTAYWLLADDRAAQVVAGRQLVSSGMLADLLELPAAPVSRGVRRTYRPEAST